MDGRWKRWACAGLLVGAVGCSRNEVKNPIAPGLPFAGEKPSMLQQAFGGGGTFTPKPLGTEPIPMRVSRKGEPPKPDTFVALADSKLEAAFMEGRPAVERDQLLDAARHQYQLALKGDPKCKMAHVGLAKLYAKAGDKERAVHALQTALQQHPKDHDLAHKLATTEIQFADWAGAVESCKYALRIDPENRTYHKTMGYCQAQSGQWDAAFGTLLKVMPEAQARYFLGRVMIDLNRLEEGRQLIQAAATLDPEFQLARQTIEDFNAGRVTRPDAVMQTGFNQGEQK